MPVKGSEIVDVELCLHHETDKGILVSKDGKRKNAFWLPRSQVEYEIIKDNVYQVTLPTWLAYDKGLI